MRENDVQQWTDQTDPEPSNVTRTVSRTLKRAQNIGETKKRCDSCGQYFKNSRGVAIHKGKTKCREKRMQRKALACKTQENQSPDAHHSAQNLQADAEPCIVTTEELEETIILERKPRLCLPPATDPRWKVLDQELDMILETSLKGDAGRKLRLMTSIVYEECKDRFGQKDQKTAKHQKAGPSRRQREIAAIRKDLRKLKQRWKAAPESEKVALKQLQKDQHSRLLQLKKAEHLRKKQREKKKAREAFFTNPFAFVSKLLGKPKSGKLECTKEEAEEAVRAAHSDPERNKPLGEIPITTVIKEPTTSFAEGDIKFDEVKAIVRKARASSAPGPSGLTYRVYKSCPKLLYRLWRLIRVLWKNKQTPKTWTLAEGCFVPKELNSTGLDQFREISLLDVEGKIFWAIVAKRLTSYLLANDYIDASVQKGGISGHSGCLEHTAAISQLIQEAKQEKSTLAIVWLDLAKAYPSVPHQLIQEALIRYHLPTNVRHLITNHLDQLKMRFTVGQFTTKWQRLEKGIMAGCTISVVLFIMAMNLIIKGGEQQCKGPKANNGTRHPPCRAFMDDITIMTQSAQGTRWVLAGLEKMTNWARMHFKAKKSRSLVIYKGTLSKMRFTVQREIIPSIQEERIKCLGKFFDESLKDVNNTNDVITELKKWLKTIESCHLLGRFKTWCFQYGIIPRLQWPFLLYDIPLTAVKNMERMCSKHLRKWLGLPPSFSTVNLYSRTSKRSLPLASVEEQFKTTKVRAVCTLSTSRDEKVRQAGDSILHKGKWQPQKEIKEAEERLQHQAIVGVVCRGRQGLGNYGPQSWTTTDPKTKRTLVVEEIRKKAEEDRVVKAVGMAKQGAWTKWESAIDMSLSWKEIWQTDQGKLSFLLRSFTDLLPSPANLKQWGLVDSAKCHLCSAPVCTLNHILCSCPKALGQGRYRWRHDKVLQESAIWVDQTRLKANKLTKRNERGHITFLREGQLPVKQNTKEEPSILANAHDWELQVDIGKKLVFPQDIVATNLRPDMLLVSKSNKTIIIMELTVPWEERMELSHQLKRAKYQDLVEEAKITGWHALLFPYEVGCRGYPSNTLHYMLRKLGIPRPELRKAMKSIGAVAESSSRWLWIMKDKEWHPFQK